MAQKATDVPHQLMWVEVGALMRSIIRKFLEAANHGHAGAQFSLGCVYYFGKGVIQDFKGAAKWFGQAAEQGNVLTLNSTWLACTTIDEELSRTPKKQ
jgi:TPR repeat protein